MIKTQPSHDMTDHYQEAWYEAGVQHGIVKATAEMQKVLGFALRYYAIKGEDLDDIHEFIKTVQEMNAQFAADHCT